MKEEKKEEKFFSSDKAKTLRKARWAFLLSYWFNRPFPAEYHQMAVNLQCCSAYGLEILLHNHILCPEAEQLIVYKFAKTNPKLVLDYLLKKKYKVGDMLLKLVQLRAYSVLQPYFETKQQTHLKPECFLPLAAWTYIIDTCDEDMLKAALEGYADVPPAGIIQMLRDKKYSMFETYCKLKPYNSRQYLYTEEINLLICCDHIPTLETAAATFCSVPCLVALAQKNQKEFLHLFFTKHSLDDDTQLELIKTRNKSLIACYIQHNVLSLPALKLLVQYKFKDLLKLHYQKHGIPEELLAYQANLRSFEIFIGIEKND